MIRFVFRALLSAFAFAYLLPLVSGIHFTGTFWPEGVIYGVLLAVVSFVWRKLIQVLLVGTLGLGLLIIVPFYVFGFWLIPAIQLQALAHFFPQHLAVDNWHAAIIGGLILMAVTFVTCFRVSSSSSTTSNTTDTANRSKLIQRR